MKSTQKEDKLYIQTFRKIRSYILRSNLQPGDLLPTEQEMSRTLGVSRNVLREAIKGMELMGMVQARPGRGTEVREFSPDFIFRNALFFSVAGEKKTVEEMLAIRKTLELSYMRQAFHALSADDVHALRRCFSLMQEACGMERAAFSAADCEFHMALFRPLGNGVLNSLLEAVWAVDKSIVPEEDSADRYETVVSHLRIVNALEDYDYRAFAHAMEAHFSCGRFSSADSLEVYG